jgi:hypothetical protein
MALADLTLEDIMGDQIDDRAFAAEAADTGSESNGSGQGTRYRIYKGEYIMLIKSVRIREAADERRSLAMVGALHNNKEKYRGTVFPEISWQYRENRNGKLDLKSRLFGNLVHALGAPQGTPLPEFIEGIVDEFVRVYVSEYFRIGFDDLLEEDKPESDSGYKTLVFINADVEGDLKANHYMDKGYDSQGMVLSIKPLEQ